MAVTRQKLGDKTKGGGRPLANFNFKSEQTTPHKKQKKKCPGALSEKIRIFK